MNNDKQSIRSYMIHKRKALTNDEVIDHSQQIHEKLISLSEYKQSDKILIYASFNNEVNTKKMIDDCIVAGRQIYLPVLISNIDFVAKEFTGEYYTNNFGIIEPINDMIQDQFDLIICPAIAFDKKLNRIGHGNGYYDRFLKNYLKTPKIGLAYEFQILDNINSDTHDIPMDMIITEKRMIFNESYQR